MTYPHPATDSELSAALAPLFQRRSHWFIAVPLPHPLAVLRFAATGPLIHAGDRLALLPVPGIGMTVIVMALAKASARPRELLGAMGFPAGLDADRLEEEMAAGKDCVCLADDENLALAVAEALRPVLEGGSEPIGSEPPARPMRRPRLRLLRRFKRRKPTYVEFGLRHGRRALMVTMGIGQWDGVLQAAYDTGATLVEVDDGERVVAVYQKGHE
jgi:hypothetical protein